MAVPAKVRQMARECVAVRVRLLNRLVTGVCDDGLRPHGVRVAQVNVLCAIANAGPITPTDLAAALVMDKSTLSRDVEKLIEKGWVETATGEDARSHTLAATAVGVAFLDEIHPPLVEGAEATRRATGARVSSQPDADRGRHLGGDGVKAKGRRRPLAVRVIVAYTPNWRSPCDSPITRPLGRMGIRRNAIRPQFGNFIILGTVLLAADVDAESRPIDYTPRGGG